MRPSLGFGEQGKGAFYIKGTEDRGNLVQFLRGTSKQRKCWGTWNLGKQI